MRRPLLPEHFPSLALDPSPATPAAQVDAAVRRWLADRVREKGGAADRSVHGMLREVEPALLEEVMRRVQGNRWAAAQWLGLNRATVRKKLGLYGLSQQTQPGATPEAQTGRPNGRGPALS